MRRPPLVIRVFDHNKSKQSLQRPGQTFGLQEVEASSFSRQSAQKRGKAVSPTHQPPLPSPPPSTPGDSLVLISVRG